MRSESERMFECGICGAKLGEAQFEKHAASHSDLEKQRFLFDKKKDGMSPPERMQAGRDLYLALRDPLDTVSVHAIEAALMNASLLQFFWDAETCNYAGCNHGNGASP